MEAIDVVTSPAIAAIVWTFLHTLGGGIPSKFKPPAAVVFGVVWAVLAFVSIDGAYPHALAAVSIGATAGAAASGLESFRATYGKPAA